MKTIHATYREGVFHPVEPVSLPAGAIVEILIIEPANRKLEETRARLGNVIGALSPEVAEQMQKDIDDTRNMVLAHSNSR